MSAEHPEKSNSNYRPPSIENSVADQSRRLDAVVVVNALLATLSGKQRHVLGRFYGLAEGGSEETNGDMGQTAKALNIRKATATRLHDEAIEDLRSTIESHPEQREGIKDILLRLEGHDFTNYGLPDEPVKPAENLRAKDMKLMTERDEALEQLDIINQELTKTINAIMEKGMDKILPYPLAPHQPFDYFTAIINGLIQSLSHYTHIAYGDQHLENPEPKKRNVSMDTGAITSQAINTLVWRESDYMLAAEKIIREVSERFNEAPLPDQPEEKTLWKIIVDRTRLLEAYKQRENSSGAIRGAIGHFDHLLSLEKTESDPTLN